jgi:hypothetical protein
MRNLSLPQQKENFRRMGQNTGLEQSYNYGMRVKIAPAIQMVAKIG